MPRDLKRWVSSCQNVNRGYDFRLYDDIDLHTFVKAEYPEYLAFFETLHGVCKYFIMIPCVTMAQWS